MSREETLKDVPGDRVGVVVQGYVDDGAHEIHVVKNPAGNWDVTAHFD
ncbi:MAG: hypothetical protein ACYSU4_12125 [Planctomycetota bacterium]|jgi:hypothetical protein